MSTTISSSGDQRLVDQLAGQPPPNASAQTIDFDEVGFTGYKDHFAILIENLFTETECQSLLAGAEESAGHKWDPAMVRSGRNGEQKLATEVRLSDRIIWDDHDIAARILDRVMLFLPPEIVTLEGNELILGKGPVCRKETWKISRLNERLRFLRYTKGMYFRPHCDGAYATPDGKEITFLTLHLYLNGKETRPATYTETEKDEDKTLLGGATRFFDFRHDKHWDVNPRTGSVLVFQHKHLAHSGDDVQQGTKYTMRSDILYRKVVE